MKIFLVSLPLLVSMYGCAAASKTTIPEGAAPLSTEEIITTFSGVKESYVSKDNPRAKVTATAIWGVDGEFESSWKAGTHKGEVTGEWYAENGKRCIKNDKPNEDGTDLECHSIYKTGDVYASVNDDGSVHGIHTLTPLE